MKKIVFWIFVQNAFSSVYLLMVNLFIPHGFHDTLTFNLKYPIALFIGIVPWMFVWWILDQKYKKANELLETMQPYLLYPNAINPSRVIESKWDAKTINNSIYLLTIANMGKNTTEWEHLEDYLLGLIKN